MKRIVATITCLLLCGAVQAEKAPQLVLENLDGSTFSLQEALKKGPVVFDFWATWCKPCIKGLPKIQALAKEYAERGVQVLTINIDGPRNLPKVRPCMQRHTLHRKQTKRRKQKLRLITQNWNNPRIIRNGPESDAS